MRAHNADGTLESVWITQDHTYAYSRRTFRKGVRLSDLKQLDSLIMELQAVRARYPEQTSERAHCERVAEQMNGFQREERVPILLRERQAARAEGYAERKRVGETLLNDALAANERLHHQLKAATERAERSALDARALILEREELEQALAQATQRAERAEGRVPV